MKNPNIKSQSGFTLVETIVVAILTTVLALGAYSVFTMYMNETREITTRIRLQAQYETLTDEIARTVREGRTVVTLDDGQTVRITDANQMVTLFTFSEGFMQVQRGETAEREAFTLAGTTIFVDKEASEFTDALSNRALITNITLLSEMENPRYTLTVNGGVFRCRN